MPKKRATISTLRSAIHPSAARAWLNAAKRGPGASTSSSPLRNPTRFILAGRCARAASCYTCRRPAEQRDEFAPLHSITSSASREPGLDQGPSAFVLGVHDVGRLLQFPPGSCLEDTVDACMRAGRGRPNGTVVGQSAARDEGTERIDGRHPVLVGERGD